VVGQTANRVLSVPSELRTGSPSSIEQSDVRRCAAELYIPCGCLSVDDVNRQETCIFLPELQHNERQVG
jgi:hypothetical protein